MTSSGKKDYKEKHGMVICYVGYMYMWASDSIYFLVKSVKFRYSEKATKFDKKSIFSKQILCGGYFQTGFCKGLKIWGACCNVVGIMCPPVEVGLTDLPKTGKGGGPACDSPA